MNFLLLDVAVVDFYRKCSSERVQLQCLDIKRLARVVVRDVFLIMLHLTCGNVGWFLSPWQVFYPAVMEECRSGWRFSNACIVRDSVK